MSSLAVNSWFPAEDKAFCFEVAWFTLSRCGDFGWFSRRDTCTMLMAFYMS